MNDMNQRSVEERLDRLEKIATAGSGLRGSYEYKSSTSIFGAPLIHLASGINPETGKQYIAKGIIAIGDIAIGIFAMGGLSLGVIAIGGFSLAFLFALGGVAFSMGVSVGGVAISSYLSIGGLAISWNYAIGGFAMAPHPLGGNYQDPEVLELLKSWFPNWKF